MRKPGIGMFVKAKEDFNIIGFISSGAMSPSLGYGIALAYIDMPYAKDLNSFKVKIRNNIFTMKKAKLPFYKNGTYLK